MRMMITEKQLSKILKKDVEIEEADDITSSSTASSSPVSSASTASSASSSSAGSSSTSSGEEGGGQGAEDYPAYPEVGHWESGVTRGPANQIGVTKWSDTVGSKLTRGKANPLK